MTEDFFEDIDYTPSEPGQGKILISEPFLFDPHFKRTIILLTEHNENGTVGFILNKSAEVPINQAIPEFPDFKDELYYGGPVSNDSLFFIHSIPELKDSQKVMDGLYWGGDYEQLKLMLDTDQVSNDQVRFFIGYSGWGIDQLASELEQKSWIVTNTTATQAMKARHKDSWKLYLKKLGKKYEILSNFPEDPNLN